MGGDRMTRKYTFNEKDIEIIRWTIVNKVDK